MVLYTMEAEKMKNQKIVRVEDSKFKGTGADGYTRLRFKPNCKYSRDGVLLWL